MPIYEYLCRACRKQTSILGLSLRNPPPAHCRHCGGSVMDRLLSRFAAPKSEEARFESLAESDDLGGLDESDPQSVTRFMKNLGREMGEDVSEDVEAMMEQAEGGEDATEDTDSQ